jgi:hypothetical protein
MDSRINFCMKLTCHSTIITTQFMVILVNWYNNRLLTLIRQFFLIPSRFNEFTASQSLYSWQSVGQSVSMSWRRAHFVDVWPDTASFSRVWVWNLLSCLCGALLWQEAGSVLGKSQSSHLSVHTFIIYIVVFHIFTMYIYTHYTIHIIYTGLI